MKKNNVLEDLVRISPDEHRETMEIFRSKIDRDYLAKSGGPVFMDIPKMRKIYGKGMNCERCPRTKRVLMPSALWNQINGIIGRPM